MYFFKPDIFSKFDPKNVNQFVECWDKYYKFSVKKINSTELIDYFSEINLGNNLTKENVINLLRWKDQRHLTHKKLSGQNKGTLNPKVKRIVNQIDKLNKFRNSEITPEEFRKVTAKFFKNGIIWEIFVFHICKPLEYPIADQHIFRTYSCHVGCKKENGWEKYIGYQKYFDSLLKDLKNSHTENKLLRNRKRLDNALMVFGQFLNTYANNANN